MTGTASSSAGSELCTSQEKAGRLTILVSRLSKITSRMTPRSSTIAWVSRTIIRMAKNINVTRPRSRMLNQLSRWKRNKRSFNKFGTTNFTRTSQP